MSNVVIELKDVPPCAVFEFNGRSIIDKGIQLLDSGYYDPNAIFTHNHDALWTGSSVASAEAQGYVELDIKDAITDTDYYVDVVVWCKDRNDIYGTMLGTKAFPFEPVLERCKYYLSQGERYGYEKILLLALLSEIRRIANTNIPERDVVDAGAESALQMIDSYSIIKAIDALISKGKQPLICSESVYRCYAEAGEQYRPIILPQNMYGVYRENAASDSDSIKKFNDVRASEAGLVADFVTPNDITMSPSFCVILGRLKYGNLKID